MEQQEFDARPFGRKPWSYERRQGKGLGKPAHYILNDADGRYLGQVILGNDEDQELVPRTICKMVNGAEAARQAMDKGISAATGIRLIVSEDIADAEGGVQVTGEAARELRKVASEAMLAMIDARKGLNGNGQGGGHA